eukprot:scaffold25778_cov129-Isochrysis_galbana.AAC.1
MAPIGAIRRLVRRAAFRRRRGPCPWNTTRLRPRRAYRRAGATPYAPQHTFNNHTHHAPH